MDESNKILVKTYDDIFEGAIIKHVTYEIRKYVELLPVDAREVINGRCDYSFRGHTYYVTDKKLFICVKGNDIGIYKYNELPENDETKNKSCYKFIEIIKVRKNIIDEITEYFETKKKVEDLIKENFKYN